MIFIPLEAGRPVRDRPLLIYNATTYSEYGLIFHKKMFDILSASNGIHRFKRLPLQLFFL